MKLPGAARSAPPGVAVLSPPAQAPEGSLHSPTVYIQDTKKASSWCVDLKVFSYQNGRGIFVYVFLYV